MAREPDPELFREVFGRFATGVAVITSAGPARRRRHDRQRAVLAVARSAAGAGVLREPAPGRCRSCARPGRFAVNVLAADQEELAGVFASKLPEAEKLDGVAHRFEHGVPVIEGALAWAACELRELIAGGDHTIAIGEVIALGLGDGRAAAVVRGPLPRRRRAAAQPAASRPVPAARTSSDHDHERRQHHHAQLALDDRQRRPRAARPRAARRPRPPTRTRASRAPSGPRRSAAARRGTRPPAAAARR